MDEDTCLLVLRIFEDKPFDEIGELLNKSEEAVKKIYSRTKIKLKSMMTASEEEGKCVHPNRISYSSLSI
ncbi:RNA polymerase sigma factor [Paenibacillus dokdonensis]|uniref:RNA polymerase sigma factor n=1 Tax=Paenibacillus dokdonensis TaxID=2567944 RepID=UPI001FE4FE86|nr:sigma factor-like helix-turn-helix DNA-binding protein [Paenibacillus dokdonensis]